MAYARTIRLGREKERLDERREVLPPETLPIIPHYDIRVCFPLHSSTQTPPESD